MIRDCRYFKCYVIEDEYCPKLSNTTAPCDMGCPAYDGTCEYCARHSDDGSCRLFAKAWEEM